jgi:predicted regulator of Ras-like GTPase activity (Roadblock/LC7/MglB family)
MSKVALEPLRDIPDVDGSFAVDRRGNVVSSDVQVFFRPESLAGAARKITNLFAIVDENYEPLEEAMVDYDRFSFFLRRADELFLAIILRPGANLTAVRMASGLVVNNLRMLASTPQPPAFSSPPVPAVATPLSTSYAPMPAGNAATNPPSPASKPAAPPPKKKNSIWG